MKNRTQVFWGQPWVTVPQGFVLSHFRWMCRDMGKKQVPGFGFISAMSVGLVGGGLWASWSFRTMCLSPLWDLEALPHILRDGELCGWGRHNPSILFPLFVVYGWMYDGFLFLQLPTLPIYSQASSTCASLKPSWAFQVLRNMQQGPEKAAFPRTVR